jgi:hypothetical protein
MLKLLDRRFPPAVAACVLFVTPAAYGAHSSRLAAPGPVILGSETLEPHHDYLIAGQSEAFRLRAHHPGLAAQARIYIDRGNTARVVVVGLYDDADGRPGSLRSTGSVSAPRRRSWATVPLAPIRLTAARTYWLTILGEDGTLRFRDRQHGRCRSDKSAQASFSRLPALWRRGRVHARTDCPVSAYILKAAAASHSPIGLAALPGLTSPPELISPTVPSAPVPAPPQSAPTNIVLPALSGTTTQGQVLSSTTGEWSGDPTSYAYQWQDCDPSGGESCSDIVGATSSSYMLAGSDVGHKLRVIVTATNAGGSTSATSAMTSKAVAGVKIKPPPPAPTNTVLPMISGMTTQGQVLSSTTGSWNGSPTFYAYQWEDCDSVGENCTDISEATASSYTLVGSDVGHTLRVVVTATNTGGSTPAISVATAVIKAPVTPPPANTVLPMISGTTTQGQVLSSTTGEWSGNPTDYAYQWQDCNSSGKSCSNVSGATNASYNLAESDVGHRLRVVVTATNAGGMTPASSAASATIIPLPPANTALPTIGGTTTEGNTLNATTGSWSGSPTNYAYQWESCDSSGAGCSNVSGATSSSYTLKASDVGDTLRVLVTATNAGGSTSATSAHTASVIASTEGSPYPECTQTISTGTDASTAVSGASAGSVICLSSGSYGSVTLTAKPSGDVTLQAAPAAHVTTGQIEISGSHLVVRGLWIDGEVTIDAGASHITLDHNDITGGGEGIVFDTSDCTVPNAPKWNGCEPLAPVTDVIISGNRLHDIGQPGTEDAIHLDNWRNVTITGNEFDHIIESGNHTDCVQSVYGGSELTFTRNYEHDNDCQGFFVKDGDATNVSFTDNLYLRDNEPDGKGEHFFDLAQFWNIHGLTIAHNTVWDGKGIVLVAEDAQNSPSATIDHNLFSYFSINKPIGTAYALTESYNVFGHHPSSFAPAATDRTTTRPRFASAGGNPYRLARNPHHVGIDWSPARQRYGPRG